MAGAGDPSEAELNVLENYALTYLGTPPTPAPTPAPAPAPGSTRIQAENGQLSGSGMSVRSDIPGYASQDEAFAATGDNWAVKTVSGVALINGTNTIAISKNWGYMEVDWIEIAQ